MEIAQPAGFKGTGDKSTKLDSGDSPAENRRGNASKEGRSGDQEREKLGVAKRLLLGSNTEGFLKRGRSGRRLRVIESRLQEAVKPAGWDGMELQWGR